MDNYKYKLQYINNDETVTFEFPADIGAEELMWKLRDFLCACSWLEDTVRNDILRIGEEE